MSNLREVLNGYKVGELKELAKAAEISGYSKLKKAELIDVLVDTLDQVKDKVVLPDEVMSCLKTENSQQTAKESPTTEPNTLNDTSAKSAARKVRQIPGTQTIQKSKKIYPNDPCPCGSGKKYKKCCGRA